MQSAIEHFPAEHVGREGFEDVCGVDIEQRPGGGLWQGRGKNISRLRIHALHTQDRMLLVQKTFYLGILKCRD